MTEFSPAPAWRARGLHLLLAWPLVCACAASGAEHRRSGGAPHPALTPPLPEDRSASPAAPEDTSLAAFVSFGLARNARLRAAFEDWQGARAQVRAAGTLPFPRFSYSEFLEEVQTRTGPQERRFGLSQSFPWPGALDARARAAEQQAEVQAHALEALRLSVERDIELAFNEYAFLGREARIRGALLDVLRGLEPAVLSRVRGGDPQEDLLRLQVEIGRLEDDLASATRRRPALSARLAEALTWTDAPRILDFPRLEVPALHQLDMDAAHARAATGPLLREHGARVQAALEGEELAAYVGKPSFTLGVDWIATSGALDPTTPGSGDDPVLLQVGLELPLWSAHASAAELGARHRVRAARERLRAAESELRADVEHEAYRVDDAARRVALYRDSLLPRAEEALQLTLASYRTGSADLGDVIESERVLLEFQLSLWRACRDFLDGEARLRALTGGETEER